MTTQIVANHSANRIAKEKLVGELAQDLKPASLMVVVDPIGLNATATRDLRVHMIKEGVSLRVAKNTLVKQAIKDTPFGGLAKFLHGTTALAYSADPVAAAKASAEFAKKNPKFKIIGAAMGEKVLEEADVKALATLPSLDQLRAKILGLILAPATKLAGIMQAPAGQLARVMSARSKQEG